MFALDHSKNERFRGDYRELLEPTIIFLGGTTHSGISFRMSGASHNAKWDGQGKVLSTSIHFS